MAVSESGNEGGKRCRVGLQLGVIREDSVISVVKLTLGAPVCWVRVETRLDKK